MRSRNFDAANRFYAAVEDTCRHLAESPELGEAVATNSEAISGIRWWRVAGFANHLIFYRKVADGMEVVRVLHAARDWPAIIESSAD